jgi:hypothetical protein
MMNAKCVCGAHCHSIALTQDLRHSLLPHCVYKWPSLALRSLLFAPCIVLGILLKTNSYTFINLLKPSGNFTYHQV